jgi:hypothetical protein
VGTSKRYVEHFDAMMRERLEQGTMPPCSLPMQAYGSQPIEWCRANRPAVWAWITWPHKACERIAAFATGWNDRVVFVEREGERRTVNAVVWRNAVAFRQTDISAPWFQRLRSTCFVWLRADSGLGGQVPAIRHNRIRS